MCNPCDLQLAVCCMDCNKVAMIPKICIFQRLDFLWTMAQILVVAHVLSTTGIGNLSAAEVSLRGSRATLLRVFFGAILGGEKRGTRGASESVAGGPGWAF